MVQDWSYIKTQLFTSNKPALLLGNGFSINLYETFEYNSLYERAVSLEFLNSSDQRLFDSLHTTNFEYVLRIIKHAELYINSYEIQGVEGANAVPSIIYNRIRNALINTIKNIHYQWDSADSQKFKSISEILERYKSIFTTNYDLLLYWTIMEKGNSDIFKDFFWGPRNSFDLSDSKLLDERAIPIYYLHGSLFLYHDLDSYAYKRIRDEDQNLLQIIDDPADDEESPLIVAEGEDSKKHNSICSSDYLEFCFNKLNNLNENLVVFGHSLNKEHDRHIIDILKRLIKTQKIAISIYNPAKETTRNDQEIERYAQHLEVSTSNSNLLFYYAHDHPLGSHDLALGPKPKEQ